MFFNILGLNKHFYLQPPVYFYLMAGIYRVVGFSQLTVRLGSAIPYILTIPLSYLVAKRLAKTVLRNKKDSFWGIYGSGLVAAFLVAFNEQSLEMARSGRPDEFAILLVLVGLLVLIEGRSRNSRALNVIGMTVASFSVLVHPFMIFPIGGIACALIVSSIQRRQFLATDNFGLLGIIPALIIALIWITGDFSAWKTQFARHMFGAANSGTFKQHIANFIDPLHLELVIVVVVVVGAILAIQSRNALAAGTLGGLLIGVVLSSESYFKFLLVFLIVFGVPGVVKSFINMRRTFVKRIVVGGIISIACLNGFAFVALRAVEITIKYHERDPQLVTSDIAKHVPRGARVLGIPDVYYAVVARHASFRYYVPLYGVRIPTDDGYSVHEFDSQVAEYRPSILILPPSIRPSQMYCYLPADYAEMDHLKISVSSGLNAQAQSSIDYVIWRVTYSGLSHS
jgi:4-amino-4-deoxy-L-arabinose transferase-like glycosyltransferase